MNPKSLNHWRTFFSILLIVSFALGNLSVPTGKVYAQDAQTPTVEPAATETQSVEPSVEPTQEEPVVSETPDETVEPTFTETPVLTEEPVFVPTKIFDSPNSSSPLSWQMTFDYSLGGDLTSDVIEGVIGSITSAGVQVVNFPVSDNNFQLQISGTNGLEQVRDVIYNKLLPKLNFLAGTALIQISQQTIANEPFDVFIESQAGTGYEWKLLSSEDDNVYEVSPSTFEDRYEGPGTTAKQKLTLKSSITGTSIYQLIYARSFGQTDPATRKLSINIGADQNIIDLSDPTPVLAGADLSDLLNHLKPLDSEMSAQDVSAQTYPSSWDWRSFSKVTAIRDQKTCGSCWSFATTGIMESSLKIFKNVTEDFSEQFLLSCNVASQNGSGKKYDCTGGTFDALDYYIDELGQGQTVVGPVRESQFGYTANASTTCPTTLTHYSQYNANDWGGISNPTVAQVKWLVSSYGPVAIGICAGTAFNDYSGGVFSTDEGTCQNHMVDIVGWDDSTGTWIIKNSWGTSWGDNGFMKMKYGISGNQTVAVVVMMSGVPEVPELGSPIGTITTATPTYYWAASDGATSYTLKVVNASNSTTVFSQSVPSSACISGTCSYQSATSLANGTNYSFYVSATNSAGTSVFGGPQNFYTSFSSATPTKTATSVPPTATPTKTATSVPPTATPSIPAATTVVYPVGDINTASVVLQWKGVAGATYYVFKITNTDTGSISTYTLGSSCTSGTCTSGTTTFGMTGTHYQITVASQNSAGTSSFSTPVTFKVLPNLLDTPTISAPTGAISYNAPTYAWQASSGATSYSGKIYEGSSTTATLSFDTTPENASCGSSCSYFVMMGLTTNKTYRFTMQATDGSKYSDIATSSFTISTPPSVPTLVGPSGEISADTPTFQWNASTGAVSYNLVVTNTDGGSEVVNTVVTSSVCVSNVCSVTSPVTLVGKNYQFKVSASNGLVSSAFSTPNTFYYTTHIPPAVPVMAGPSDGITADKPTFTWAPVTGAANYTLKVTDTDSSTVALTVTVSASACDASLCSYVATSSLLGQNYQSEVYASNIYGKSSYSEPLAFYYTNHIPPAAPTLVSPSGETNSDNPTYQWNAISDATKYHLLVTDLDDDSTVVDQDVATSSCTASTCSYKPSSVTLLGQNYEFTVKATNIYGDGDYASPMGFNYTYHVAPDVPVTTSPDGAITSEKPVFRWNAVSNASSYQLVVTLNDSATITLNQTVASSACVSGVCSFTPATTLSGYDYSFKVASKNIYAQSDYSADRNFWISTHALPMVPTIIGPVGEVSADQPTYQWNTAEGATSYLLKVTETNTNTVVLNGLTVSTSACSGTTCSYKQTSNLTGQNYEVEVAAKNAIGNSDYSEPMSFYYTTHVAPEPPDTLVAPSGNIYVEQPTYKWNSVSGATSYQLQVTNTDTSAVVVNTTVAGTSCSAGVCSTKPTITLSALNYSFTVKAINTYGSSDASTPMVFVVASHQPPMAPVLVSPTGDITNERPTYTWNISLGATGYQLKVTRLDDDTVVLDQSVGTTACGTTTCSITPLNTLMGHEYQFEVKAKNAYGESAASDALAFTYPTHIPPGAPTLIGPEGDLGTKTPAYQWTPVSGATSYLLKVVDTDSETTLISQIVQTTACDASKCSFTPTTRLTGINYSFTVTAINSFGQTESSPLVLKVLLPANPTLLAPNSSVEELTPTFKWTVVPAVTSYTIKVINFSTHTVILSKSVPASECEADACETTFDEPLEYGYYNFEVAATNDYGQGDFVLSEMFGQYLPAKPVVTAPADSVYDLKPIVKWKAVKGAISYDLKLINTDTDVAINIPGLTKACASNSCAYTLTNALSDGNYRVEVVATNFINGKSEAGTSTFTYLYHTAPAVPVTTSPTGTVYVQKATFQWVPVARATGYVLRIFNGDGSKLLDVTVPSKNCKGTVCSYTTAIVLNDGDYSYQVASVNTFGPSSFSTAVPFSNHYRTAPDAVTLSAPNTTVYVQKPVYQWVASSRASSYLLTLVNTDTSTILSNLSVSSSYCKAGVCKFTQPTVLVDGNYAFHVTAVNAFGSSDASSDMAFTVDYVSAPPVPVITGPVGTAYTSKPKFTWNASARATGYELYWINLDQPTVSGDVPLTSSVCKNNLCAYIPSIVLPDGNYQFEVKAKNAFGQSDFSDAASFVVNAHELSPAPTTVSPNTSIYAAKVPFTWITADRATSYRLIVTDTGSSLVKFNGILAASKCKNGSCTFTPSVLFPDGNYQFSVSSNNANGESEASTPLSFSVSATTVSAVPELISPTGVTNVSQPVYQWKAAGGATGYLFSIVNTGTSNTVFTTSVKATVCKNGICSLIPAINLANGNYKFTVTGTNLYGNSETAEMEFSVFGFNSQFVKDSFGWNPRWLNFWKLSGGSYLASGVGYADVYSLQSTSFEDVDYTVRIKRAYGMYLKDGFYSAPANSILVHAATNSAGISGGYEFAYFDLGVKGDSVYAIFKYYPDGTRELIQVAETTSIVEQNWNTLRVTAADDIYNFYINDQLVYTFTDSDYSRGLMGVNAGQRGNTSATTLYIDWATLSGYTAPEGGFGSAISPEQQALNEAGMDLFGNQFEGSQFQSLNQQ